MEHNGKRKIIPKSSIEIEVDSSKKEGISSADISLINDVQSFFESQGVIARETNFNGAETLDEVNLILSEASSVSQSEEELNPNYYDPRVAKLLEGLEGEPNRILYDFEDYEGQPYDVGDSDIK